MFDSFYFLHIPKTAGRYFLKTVVYPIHDNNPHIKEMHTPKEFANKNHELMQVTHRGWIPEINENTYVCSILRDPIKRAASHYVYTVANRIKSVDDDGQEEKIISLDKKYFMQTLEMFPKWHNYSSKNFLYDMSDYKDFVSLSDSNSFMDQKNIDKLFERVKRTNLLIKTDTLKNVPIEEISAKVSSDLGIKNNYYTDETKYILESSKMLYRSLTENDKKEISKYFEVDYEIYNDQSLFWSPK